MTSKSKCQLLPTLNVPATRQLARLAVAFGMVVMIAEGSSPTPCSGRAEETDPRASEREATASQVGVTLPPLPLDELLSKSDFFSVHCPLTTDTKGLISKRELALMKPSAVVINAARGGVVDELGARVLLCWML